MDPHLMRFSIFGTPMVHLVRVYLNMRVHLEPWWSPAHLPSGLEQDTEPLTAAPDEQVATWPGFLKYIVKRFGEKALYCINAIHTLHHLLTVHTHAIPTYILYMYVHSYIDLHTYCT